jgi:hypothetical protein
MTTMTTPVSNGHKRSSLNDQINRLDSMLDGLSDGLNEAVADAVKNAVASAAREAVQSVLADVLTSPAMIARLQTAIAPQVQARTPAPAAAPRICVREKLSRLWTGVRNCIANLRSTCGDRVRRMRTSAANFLQQAVARAVGLWTQCQVLGRFKFQILTAVGIGATVGVVAWHASPLLAAAVSGVGGFATALSVQVGMWLRDVLGGNSEGNARA